MFGDTQLVSGKLDFCRVNYPSSIIFEQPFIGALAQLGERLPCTQEVSGSTPLGSTIF